MRKLLTAALFALVAIGLQAPPAMAGHQNFHNHWGHGYRPAVTAACFDSDMCAYTGPAENNWANHWGFRNGFSGGHPFYGCGPFGGWISVCGRDKWQLEAERGAGTLGYTTVWYVANPNWHADAARVYICNYSCALSGYQRQNLVTHEYGHAIGLGHNGNWASVMYQKVEPNGAWSADSHDVWALRDVMYNGHWD